MPDLLIHNARIWTNDPAQPWADAALARDGRWLFVGREADATIDAQTQRYDARGRFVIPGFTDGHAHLLNTGFAMSGIDLKGVPAVEEAARRVSERARTAPAGAWLRGAGIRRGYVHGESDKTASSPKKDPVHPIELLATIYHSFGIDPHTLVYNHLNQPRELVQAEPVTSLFA